MNYCCPFNTTTCFSFSIFIQLFNAYKYIYIYLIRFSFERLTTNGKTFPTLFHFQFVGTSFLLLLLLLLLVLRFNWFASLLSLVSLNWFVTHRGISLVSNSNVGQLLCVCVEMSDHYFRKMS